MQRILKTSACRARDKYLLGDERTLAVEFHTDGTERSGEPSSHEGEGMSRPTTRIERANLPQSQCQEAARDLGRLRRDQAWVVATDGFRDIAHNITFRE